MTRTYYISADGKTFEKVRHSSPEDRLNFHKVEALNKWIAGRKGFGKMSIRNVYTISEMRANGYAMEG